VLVDVMTGTLLRDVLPEEVTTTLWAQFDILHGGSLFGPPEPVPVDD
jgi:hypothetical protein